jgi:hypothetical protein
MRPFTADISHYQFLKRRPSVCFHILLHYHSLSYMSESNLPSKQSEEPFSGQDVLYRERGLTLLDVQRAADALLRQGVKPSIAAVREQLGGGSPNTVGPLLEQYWHGLGQRLPEGPKALERVPESLARLSETLWLRALAEARERLRILSRPEVPPTGALASLEQKLAELTAALAEARAEISRKESELLAAIQDRLSQSEQVRCLTALLTAEQQLRAAAQGQSDTQARELKDRRAELTELARRRLARYSKRTRAPARAKKKEERRLANSPQPREKRPIAKRRAKPRTRLKRQGHR